MARPKRVPYKPDRFQHKGRKVAEWLHQREAFAIIAVAVVVLAFVLAVVFTTTRGASEERALAALYKHAGDLERLEQALAEYGSTSARAFMLLEVANVSLQKPVDEGGRPKGETDAERGKRLDRAEKALKALVRDYPKHELRLYGLTLLATVLEEEGEHKEAVNVLKKALEVAPASLEGKVRYDIGRLYVLTGDVGAARPYLLEARARTSRLIEVPLPYGRGSTRQRPAWFVNAEYLLARIGTGEKRVEFPERRPKKGSGPEKEGGSREKGPRAPEAPKTIDLKKPKAGEAAPSKEAAPEGAGPKAGAPKPDEAAPAEHDAGTEGASMDAETEAEAEVPAEEAAP